MTFLSYISSLYDVIHEHDINVGGYADDNQLYISFKPSLDGKNEQEAVAKLNECINDVRKWMLQHKLKINDGKTKFIIIRGAKQLSKINGYPITVGSSKIQPVKKVRNLGVIFDDQLSMKDHIIKVCQTGFHQLYRLRQIRKYFDQTTMESLVHSFVTSHIDYGNAMLYGLPDSSINKLQRLQNAAARLIMMKSKRDSISEILKSLHWLPVRQRIHFKICLMVYKCLNGKGPQYLQELLQNRPHTRTLRSSSQNLLLVPKMRTETFGKRAFVYAGPKLWNELPLHIRDSDSLIDFKKKLKTFLFCKTFSA